MIKNQVPKQLRCNRGFMMASLLAAMTIGGILMLNMNKLVSDQVRAQRNIAVKASFDNTMLQLRQYLSYQNNCTSSLLPPTYALPENNHQVPNNVSSINQIPFSGTPLISVGFSSSDYTVTSISLENFSAPAGTSPNSFLVNLVVQASKKTGSIGTAPLRSSIPLYVQLSPVSGLTRQFISCALSSNNCSNGKFYQSNYMGCVPPVELLTADPSTPFQGEMWLRTDL